MTLNHNPNLEALSREELLELLLAEVAKNASLHKDKHDKNNGSARDHELLGLLLEGPKSGAELATAMNCSKANVASYLSYLRKDGCTIAKDFKDSSKHRLFAVSENAAPYVKRMATAAGFKSVEIG